MATSVERPAPWTENEKLRLYYIVNMFPSPQYDWDQRTSLFNASATRNEASTRGPHSLQTAWYRYFGNGIPLEYQDSQDPMQAAVISDDASSRNYPPGILQPPGKRSVAQTQPGYQPAVLGLAPVQSVPSVQTAFSPTNFLPSSTVANEGGMDLASDQGSASFLATTTAGDGSYGYGSANSIAEHVYALDCPRPSFDNWDPQNAHLVWPDQSGHQFVVESPTNLDQIEEGDEGSDEEDEKEDIIAEYEEAAGVDTDDTIDEGSEDASEEDGEADDNNEDSEEDDDEDSEGDSDDSEAEWESQDSGHRQY